MMIFQLLAHKKTYINSFKTKLSKFSQFRLIKTIFCWACLLFGQWLGWISSCWKKVLIISCSCLAYIPVKTRSFLSRFPSVSQQPRPQRKTLNFVAAPDQKSKKVVVAPSSSRGVRRYGQATRKHAIHKGKNANVSQMNKSQEYENSRWMFLPLNVHCVTADCHGLGSKSFTYFIGPVLMNNGNSVCERRKWNFFFGKKRHFRMQILHHLFGIYRSRRREKKIIGNVIKWRNIRDESDLRFCEDVALIKYILKKLFHRTNMAIFIHYSINGQGKSAIYEKTQLHFCK